MEFLPAIIGSLLPHARWLFGGLTGVFNTQALVEITAIKTLGTALQYRGIRIFAIVAGSLWLALWTVEQTKDVVETWHHHGHHVVGFASAFGISGGLGRLFRVL